MPEIFKFPIPEAYAERWQDGIKVTLIYPDERDRQYSTERRLSTKEDIVFGIDCLERLLSGERVQIGTTEHPSRPACGGILDVFDDGSFLTHRRDGRTKVHPWYDDIPSGFPAQREDFDNIESLERTEGAEESILFSKNDNGIYVPNDKVGARVTRSRIALLGLRNRTRQVLVDYEEGDDLLVIQDASKKIISTTRGSIYLSWEVETNVAIAARRYWPTLNSEEIAAIDAEGFRDGKIFTHYNREKFHMKREEIAGVLFDQEIPMPRRYKLKIENDHVGSAMLVPAAEGEIYRFRPDGGLRRMLDTLGIKGWKDKWIQYEITEARKRLDALKE